MDQPRPVADEVLQVLVVLDHNKHVYISSKIYEMN